MQVEAFPQGSLTSNVMVTGEAIASKQLNISGVAPEPPLVIVKVKASAGAQLSVLPLSKSLPITVAVPNSSNCTVVVITHIAVGATVSCTVIVSSCVFMLSASSVNV